MALLRLTMTVFMLLCSSALPNADEIPSTLGQRVSLDLRNVAIDEALKFLSMKTGINIVYTKAVTGQVTLTVEDASIQDILDIMLRSNSLAYDKKGEIYSIMTEAEYKAIYGKNFSDVRQVKVFRLKYAVPEQAFGILDALKSDVGRIFVDTESGTVLVLDTPQKINDVEMVLSEFEQKNAVQVFNLKYAKAKDAEEVLRTQLDLKNAGSIKADERTNQVIVQTLPERMKEIERLIKDLDTETKQVLIDTKIIKVKLSNEMAKGLEWEGLFNMGKEFGMSYLGSYPFSAVQPTSAAWRSRQTVLTDMSGGVGSFPFSGTTSNFSASTKQTASEKMHIGVVSKRRDFDALFKYLQTLGETRVLSNPTLAVVNNQEAKFHVGERQAYVTTTTTTGQTTSTISEQVTFVDVGIKLVITPNINDAGFVTMKINPEISTVVSELVTPTNNKIPIIDTSTAETTVMVKDSTTLIIGGLRKEEKTHNAEQTPILGKLPVLGTLFSSKTDTVERTELIVLLTPYIVKGSELTTGDERTFGYKPGIEHKGYEPIALKEHMAPPEGTDIKSEPYEDTLTLKDDK